jgi:uncharacterized protein
MAVVKSKTLKIFLFSIGVFFVLLGCVGAFLPLIPTTPFILCAAWFFLKSSKKAHHWIYSHSIFSSSLRNWEENRAISIPTKVVSSLMISFSGLYTYWKIDTEWVRYCLISLLFLITTFIISRRSEKM